MNQVQLTQSVWECLANVAKMVQMKRAHHKIDVETTDRATTISIFADEAFAQLLLIVERLHKTLLQTVVVHSKHTQQKNQQLNK